MTDAVATVPLALFDFVPVLLAGAGCFLLARVVARGAADRYAAAMVGASLVLLGGLAKATWKLVLALDAGDVRPLEVGLFALLAPGFTLLVWALLATLGHRIRAAFPAVLVVAAEGAALALRSTGPLLGLTIVAATGTGVIGLLLARRLDDGPAAWLFGTQLLLAFALVPLASPPHTVSKQWLEEGLNTVGQAAFVLASTRLARRAMTAAHSAPERVLTGSSR